ncbi:hypothetical protein P1P68_02525 [Streptomyces scabiei]|uniref:hypothetical protein n=1 Tax=Streptomyces scabiei TaxID=1930 RepID=UPI00298FC007|nr:hypothetical protein [Streptomyces scabiei]MDW8803711.1 hypothetical protein [Streptomyces scabiei]
MWIFDALASGFRSPTDPGRLQLFRIVYGTVLTVRFALSFGQGGWKRFAPGSLSLRLAEQRFGPRRGRLLARLYRPALIARTTAAATLAAGIAPRLALLAVLAGAAMELLYLKNPGAVRFTLLTGGCLLAAGNLGHGLTLDRHPSTANTFAQVLLVIVTTDLYWNSAFHKLRSAQFRTGLYLAQWMHAYTQLKDQLPYRRQHAIPAVVHQYTGNLTTRDIRLWRLVSVTVITAEIALPFALLIPAATPYAAAAGIGMHAAFTLLKPRQLVTFSGLTIGSYVAFAA